METDGTPQEKERCPDVLVLTCGMSRVLEAEEERSGLDGEYARRRPDR